LVDIVGTDENSDVAIEKTATGFRVAVINYNAGELHIALKPGLTVPGRKLEWIDLVNDQRLGEGQLLKIRIPGGSFRAVEYRLK
jgi:hypothetical protein